MGLLALPNLMPYTRYFKRHETYITYISGYYLFIYFDLANKTWSEFGGKYGGMRCCRIYMYKGEQTTPNSFSDKCNVSTWTKLEVQVGSWVELAVRRSREVFRCWERHSSSTDKSNLHFIQFLLNTAKHSVLTTGTIQTTVCGKAEFTFFKIISVW